MQFARIYYTLIDLRWQQIWYRLWYPVKRRFYVSKPASGTAIAAALDSPHVELFDLPVFDRYFPEIKTFRLLNISQEFLNGIDWNLPDHGMLWTYHLNYFGWLEAGDLSVASRLETLKCFSTSNIKIGLHSYPASLRTMAVIRFCQKNKVKEKWLAELLYLHCNRLFDFPEYQIQGNHLWQNACALLCAGQYFNDFKFYQKGKHLLTTAVKEQVLEDGGHIEGSPMYHAEVLSSLLQYIELSGKLSMFDDPAFNQNLISIAAKMLGWLEAVSFSNGDWPNVNDSTGAVAPNLKTLTAFASNLNIYPQNNKLSDSGYRMIRRGRYELFIDAGAIQPVWQPGHGHSDELSFCLNIDGQPVMVDPGISTYELGETRNRQRSSGAHNTLSIDQLNASDIWAGFRVGKKAKVSILREDDYYISMMHNGFGANFIRTLTINNECIIIEDTINHTDKKPLYLNLHFDSNIFLKKYSISEFLAGNLQIIIEGNSGAEIETYYLSKEFNIQVPAQRLHIRTGNHTITRLQILNVD